MFYIHFIVILYHFWYQPIDIVPVAIFCMFFTSQEINTKRSPTVVKLFVDFFGPEDIQWAEKHLRGSPRGAQPTRVRLEAQARPGGVCPPRVPLGRLFTV